MKPVAQMTTQKTKPWELKLSPVHLVIVLGLITGSMAGAFYLGFSSGQHVGYESALHATLSNMARLPIPLDESDATSTDDAPSDVYAKLTNPTEKEDLPIQHDAKGKDKDMPELGAIASTETLPILPDSMTKDVVVKEGAGANGANETLGSLVHRDSGHTAEAAVSSSSKEAAIETLSSSSVAVEAAVPKEPLVETAKSAPVEHAASSAHSVAKHDEKVVAKEATVVKGPIKASEPPLSKKEPATSTAVRSVIPSGWYVQVAAPRQIGEANEIAATLRRAKIPVMIEAAQVRGEDYYRVVAGPQPQRAGAEKILAQIKGNSSVKGDPFVRAVK